MTAQSIRPVPDHLIRNIHKLKPELYAVHIYLYSIGDCIYRNVIGSKLRDMFGLKESKIDDILHSLWDIGLVYLTTKVVLVSDRDVFCDRLERQRINLNMLNGHRDEILGHLGIDKL